MEPIITSMLAFCMTFGPLCVDCSEKINHLGMSVKYETCCCLGRPTNKQWEIDEAVLTKYGAEGRLKP